MLVTMEKDHDTNQQSPLICIVQNATVTGVNYGTGNNLDTGQNLPQLTQNLPQLTQNLPQLEQNLPQSGQNVLQSDQNIPQSGQNLGQSVPYLGHNLPPPPPLVRHGHTSSSVPSAEQEVNKFRVQGTKDNVIGYIVAIRDGVESEELAMCSNVFTIGSARSNDIVVENAAYHEILLQADQYGKVVMFHNDARFLEGRYLRDNEDFSVGNKSFKWKYTKGHGSHVEDDKNLCDVKMECITDDQPPCNTTTSVDSKTDKSSTSSLSATETPTSSSSLASATVTINRSAAGTGKLVSLLSKHQVTCPIPVTTYQVPFSASQHGMISSMVNSLTRTLASDLRRVVVVRPNLTVARPLDKDKKSKPGNPSNISVLSQGTKIPFSEDYKEVNPTTNKRAMETPVRDDYKELYQIKNNRVTKISVSEGIKEMSSGINRRTKKRSERRSCISVSRSTTTVPVSSIPLTTTASTPLGPQNLYVHSGDQHYPIPFPKTSFSNAPDTDSLDEILDIKDEVIRDCLDEMLNNKEHNSSNDSSSVHCIGDGSHIDIDHILDIKDDTHNVVDHAPDIKGGSKIDFDHVLDSKEDGSDIDNEFDIEEDDSCVDSDYIPDCEDDSDIDSDLELDSEPESLGVKHTDGKNAPVSSKRNNVINAVDKVQKSVKGITDKDHSSTENLAEDAVVQICDKSKDKRVYDKIHYCLYCGKSHTKVTRHYLHMHKDEDDVKTILSLNKDSPERSLELVRLRNKGDYQHNLNVLRSRKGVLVPFSRTKSDRIDDYLPCEDCLGFFRKDNLWRHRKTCPFKTGNTKFGSKVQASAKLLLPSSVDINENLKENVIKKMRFDEVTKCVKNDSIIVKLGEKLYRKQGQHLSSLYISQNMRELARLLIVARKEDPDIKCLSDIINPVKFEVAVKAIKSLCGFNESTNCFVYPTLAQTIGLPLKKCARIKKSESLMNKSSDREDAENFLALMENEWDEQITNLAQRSLTKTPKPKNGKTKELHSKRNSNKSKPISVKHKSEKSVVFNSSTKEKEIQVQSSANTRTKRQACVYCGALSTKLPRHFYKYHADEVEVEEIMKLEKNSKEKRVALLKLASKGNFVHNQKVKDKGSGLIIPKIRPVKNTTHLNYLPCEYCLAFVVDKEMWRHHKNCVSKPKGVKSDGPICNAKLLLPKQYLPKHCSEQLYKHVVSKLRDDEISSKIKSDPLILEFGQSHYDETGQHERIHHVICQMLRILARCLNAIQQQDNTVTNLSDVITVVRWNLLIDTVKKEAGFNTESEKYEKPWFVIKCGRSLKKCAKILIKKCNENGDEKTREEAEQFVEMYEKKWYEVVGEGARGSVNSRKRNKKKKNNKVKLVPLVEDVIKVSKYIDLEIDKAKNDTANSSVLEEAYAKMCKLTLAQVILFNRSRAGEAETLTKEAFSKGSLNRNIDKEVKSCLSKFEQELCETHVRVETREMRGKKMTILFTPVMEANVKFLLSLHENLGISSKYIFRHIHGSTPYRGTHTLTKIAHEAELMYANQITSAGLRKQLSMLFQVMCVCDTNQDILTKFIGLDVKRHTKFNRLPEEKMVVAKVARLLHLLKTTKTDGTAQEDIDDSLPIEDEANTDEEDSNVHLAPTVDRGQGEERNSEDNDAVENVDTPVVKRNLRSGKKRNLVVKDDVEYNDDSEDETWQPPVAKRKLMQSDSDDFEDSDSQQEMTKRKKVKQKKYMTADQREALHKAFQNSILMSKVPGKQECSRARKSFRVLARLDWKTIKFAVYNIIQRNKRNSNNLDCSSMDFD